MNQVISERDEKVNTGSPHEDVGAKQKGVKTCLRAADAALWFSEPCINRADSIHLYIG